MYEELIAALRYCDGGECDGCCRYKKEHGTECYTLLRDAADAIEELSKPRWISVKDRLPEDGVDVLCWLRTDAGDCYVSAGWYETIFKMWDLDSEYALSRHVTHWMPLPEPPKINY